MTTHSDTQALILPPPFRAAAYVRAELWYARSRENHPDFDPRCWFLIRGPPDRRHSYVCNFWRTNDELQAQETPHQEPQHRCVSERDSVALEHPVARELMALIAQRGKPGVIVSDNAPSSPRMRSWNGRRRCRRMVILPVVKGMRQWNFLVA